MKELLITVYGGGDDAVAAVQRIGDDWRAMLEQAASEVELLQAERQELWRTISDMKAAAETAGYVFSNTDSGLNLVR